MSLELELKNILENILSSKTIKSRKDLLSEYVSKSKLGSLNEEQQFLFKKIFKYHYNPDENQEKIDENEIEDVYISYDKAYNTKCFFIVHKGIHWPCGQKRLSGSIISDDYNINKAFRDIIKPQILKFRETNPLNKNDTCPILLDEKLGSDAEVDHVIPFNELVKTWKKNNSKPKIKYNIEKHLYVIEEPWRSNWYNFHQDNAILRYTSKKGNRIAHLKF